MADLTWYSLTLRSGPWSGCTAEVDGVTYIITVQEDHRNRAGQVERCVRWAVNDAAALADAICLAPARSAYANASIPFLRRVAGIVSPVLAGIIHDGARCGCPTTVAGGRQHIEVCVLPALRPPPPKGAEA